MKQDLIRKANASNNLRVVKKNKTKDKVRKMNIDTSANKTMHWISAFNIAVDELRESLLSLQDVKAIIAVKAIIVNINFFIRMCF